MVALFFFLIKDGNFKNMVSHLFSKICVFYRNNIIQSFGVPSSYLSVNATILHLSFPTLNGSQDLRTAQESKKASLNNIFKCFAFPKF